MVDSTCIFFFNNLCDNRNEQRENYLTSKILKGQTDYFEKENREKLV